MGTYRLLVATWGKPSTWKGAIYLMDGKEEKGYSTLPLLRRVLKPDATLVVAVDTLAEKEDIEESGGDYSRLLEVVEIKRIRNVAENMGISLKETDVAVLPGIGTYGGIRFSGDVRDFTAELAVELAGRLLPVAEDESVKSIEICLDITHGINYMPTLAYEVVRELADAIATVKDVRIRVFNSEPYPPGADLPRLRIMSLLDEVVVPTFAYRAVGDVEPVEQHSEGASPDIIKQAKDIWRSIAEDGEHGSVLQRLNALLGAVANAYPLGICAFCISREDRKKVFDVLETVRGIYRRGVSLGETYVTRSVKYNTNAIVSTSKALLLAGVICSAVPNRPKVTVEDIRHVLKKVLGKNRLALLARAELNMLLFREAAKKVGKIKPEPGKIAEERDMERGSSSFTKDVDLQFGFSQSAVEVSEAGKRTEIGCKEGWIRKLLDTWGRTPNTPKKVDKG